MDQTDFLRQIRWMRSRINQRRNLLITMQGRPFLSTQVAHDSENLVHHLDITELMATATRPRGRRSLPASLHRRYDGIIEALDHQVMIATQEMLVGDRRVWEVTVTWSDVQANSSCRICMQRFEEGEVAGEVTVCSHRFHLNCIAQRYMFCARCPVCNRRI